MKDERISTKPPEITHSAPQAVDIDFELWDNN